MTITVRQLAEWVQGEVLGDGEQIIFDARPLADRGPVTSLSWSTSVIWLPGMPVPPPPRSFLVMCR